MIEQIANILVVSAGILWSIEMFPQIRKTLRTKSVEDISPFLFIMCWLAFILFLTGVGLKKDMYIFLSNLLPFINVSIMLALILKYRRRRNG